MDKHITIDDFENPPPPPKFLYKYLSADRVENVLAQGTVRFTSLTNTNDIFEVRSTFHKLAGPRFMAMLAEQSEGMLTEDSLDQRLAEALAQRGLTGVTPAMAKAMAKQKFGQDFVEMMRTGLRASIQAFVPHLNDPKYAEELLMTLGRDMLCFSLSERCDNPAMWAHYAGNHTGLVVAFDTSHDWFRHPRNPVRLRLQKVKYFDGKVEEPLEDIQAAFISKTSHWSYEQEWRMYANDIDVDRTVGSPEDPIHLLSFPRDAVTQVVVGNKATADTVASIRAALAKGYSAVPVVRAVPDRNSQTIQFTPL